MTRLMRMMWVELQDGDCVPGQRLRRLCGVEPDQGPNRAQRWAPPEGCRWPDLPQRRLELAAEHERLRGERRA